MFNQSTKKQTTLGFALKSSGTRVVSSTKTTVRSAPYSRANVARQPSGDKSGIQTNSKSQYFGVARTGNNEYRTQPNESFGKELSAAVNSHRRGVRQDLKNPIGRQDGDKGKIMPSAKASLSERQREAFDLAVNQRKNMFITGSAGTGKSVLLREIINAFKTTQSMTPEKVQVTASTGIAAFHIQGKTIHSFSGVGIAKGSAASILSFVQKSRYAIQRWQKVEVLIIDEVSMLEGSLFDTLEFIARTLRDKKSFFGGIQVILTGDFYQLPPVDKTKMVQFAFESQAWHTGIKTTVVLTHVFRQKDMRFVDMLNEIRLGRLSDNNRNTFIGLSRKPNYPDDGIQATELYALRHQVDDANNRRLKSLKGNPIVFNAYDAREMTKGKEEAASEEMRKKIDSVCLAPRRIELKLFAQVMLIKNMPENSLVNGSRGVIIGFTEMAGRQYPLVRFTTGLELTMTPETHEIDISNSKYRRVQVPLILAWALSIHKSQGQTIDRLLVDLGKVFEKGQAYVALSRAVNLESLQVLNFRAECVMAHPRVIQYYADLSRRI